MKKLTMTKIILAFTIAAIAPITKTIQFKSLNKSEEWQRTKTFVKAGMGIYGLGLLTSRKKIRDNVSIRYNFNVKNNKFSHMLGRTGCFCMMIPVMKYISDYGYSKIEHNRT